MVLKRLFYHSKDFLKHTVEEVVYKNLFDLDKQPYKGLKNNLCNNHFREHVIFQNICPNSVKFYD